MRATTQEQSGAIGANEVSGNFERINWGPVPNSYHDLGTDLLVQARDSRLFDRGLLVGVQVKGGPSFFTEPKVNQNGEVIGWWYRENSATHFEDWVTHDLPHLLVLHDLETRVSYWAHVTADNVITTGKGAKILVPKSQTVDPSNSEALLNVAASRRPVISYEGSLWAGGATSVSPGRRLRHALIAPRIIAPHRNSGFTQAIGPLEAISLLCEGRIRDLDTFTKKHATVLPAEEALSSKDWLWRFYGALYLTLSGNGSDELLRRTSDAESPEQRSAACIASACILADQERHAEAVALLSKEIKRDDAPPTDFAWLLTQRARLRAEVGDISGARDDAARAQRELIGTTDDITSSAIRAAATSLLFETADWKSRDIENLATATDTTISWWRSRSTSIGLSQFFEDTFQSWAGNSSRKVNFEDVANNRLFAAQLNAHLTGEHGAWRSLSSLLARHTLMISFSACDHNRSASAINELRCSGDASSLEKTLRKVRTVGPLSILVDAAQRMRIDNWTHTTARCNLAFWELCGDLLKPEEADRAARFCLSILRDSSDFIARIQPTFKINYYVPRALAGLLPACSDQLHREVARFLAESKLIDDTMTVESYSRFAKNIRTSVASEAETAEFLRQAVATQKSPKLLYPITALLSSADMAYKQKLLDEITKGDLDALAAFDDLRELTEPAASAIAQVLKERLRRIIQDSREGKHTLYTIDTAGCLSLISALHPACAEWGIVKEFLKAATIPNNAKRQTYISIAYHASALPPDLIAEIREIAATVPIGSPVDGFFGVPIGAAATFLPIVTGSIEGDALKGVIAKLLNGSPQERSDAARIMSILRQDEYALTLVALLDDSDENVRISAASALASWAAADDAEPDAVISHGLSKAMSDQGFQIPMAVASAVMNTTTIKEKASQILKPLKDHPSAIVRQRVAQASGSNA